MTYDLLPRLTAALADRYRVERELGAGGMAVVYLAHDLRHDSLFEDPSQRSGSETNWSLSPRAGEFYFCLYAQRPAQRRPRRELATAPRVSSRV